MNLVHKQWFALPLDFQDIEPSLFDGDSYQVRLADGSEVWANFYDAHLDCNRFKPCDDAGNDIGDFYQPVVAVYSTRKMNW